MFAFTRCLSLLRRVASVPAACRYGWLLPALLVVATAVSAQPSGVQIITEVSRVRDASETPPGPDAPWEAYTLPLGSLVSEAENRDAVFWFQFTLAKPADGQPHSLYFYRYNRLIDVYLNGDRVGGDRQRPGFHTQAWNHPLLVNLQAGSWVPGDNIVQVRFQGTWLGGAFREVIFGPTDVLEQEHERRRLRQLTLNHWVLMFGVFGCVLALLLWVQRRQDQLYLLFAGGSACWLVVAAHMVIYYNPVPYQLWLVIVHVAIDCWMIFLHRFLQELLQIRAQRANRLALGLLVASLLWHGLMIDDYWWLGAYVVHLLLATLILLLLLRIFRQAWQEKRGLAVLMSTVVLIQAAFFVRDVWVLFSVPNEPWISSFHLSLFAFPLMQLVFLATLVQHFVRALNTAEELNRELETKVEDSRRHLERTFLEKRRLELEQAAERERVKIYRELHDDVGSKLLSIVHAGRDTRLGALAATALESLRDAVSRANYQEQALGPFLADLREETTLRLQGSGHTVSWQQESQLPALVLSAQQAFNLNRIFKEVVSIIIRHAAARHVLVSVSQVDDGWQFVISDDGMGFDPAMVPGNGIRNLRARAADLGAEIDWQSANHQGTTVQVSVALG